MGEGEIVNLDSCDIWIWFEVTDDLGIFSAIILPR